MVLSGMMNDTYSIEKSIGEGGGGVVYLGYHKRLKKKVVLKKIKGEISAYINNRAEVDALKDLRHSFIPQVIDFIESPEGAYTVMDYIEGESLQQKIDRGYVFSEKEIRKYAEQLCEAVEYLHSQKTPLIHGDIKPDNVMVNPDGNVCLIDFNISGFLTGGKYNTVGYTPGYSSPEQKAAYMFAADMGKNRTEKSNAVTVLMGENDASEDETVLIERKNLSKENSEGINVDTRSDIYSIGATIYALLGENVNKIGNGKLTFPNETSDGLRIVLSKAVEINPKHRYQTISDMLKALRQVDKLDKSYRSLLRRQHLKIFICCGIIAISIILVVLGKRRIDDEFEERYDEYVITLKNTVKDEQDLDTTKQIYKNALDIHDDRIEPYYYMGFYLYSIGETDQLKELVSEVEDKCPKGDDETYSKLWYLMATSLFEAGDYLGAEDYFYQAMCADTGNASVYRDYAISLIYSGKLQQAEEVLQEASNKGMARADIYMVRGELAKIQRNYDEAIECFSEVIVLADDEQQKLRAYISYSKCCLDVGTEDELDKCVEKLNDAVSELSLSSRLLVLEQLGAVHIKLGEMNNDINAFEDAVKVYENIVEMSWASPTTYSNLVVLNLRVHQLDEAEKWSEKMCERYPDNYISYMRRALVEIEKQNNVLEKERDYELFFDYYKKADELYSIKAESGIVDSEMLLLQSAFSQLKAGRWIE